MNPSYNSLRPSCSVYAENKVDAVGHLKISLIYPDRVEVAVDEDNLIVIGGRQLVLAPLYLTGRVSDPIATLRVGNGGTLDTDGKFPKTPPISQSSLYSQILSTAVSYSFDSTRPSVTFLADIAETDANGTLLNEAGLFTTGGTMFNIKTFGGIPKTSAFSVHFEWTIAIA